LETIYGHLSKQIVTENQIVRAGDPIGLGGNTGRSTGSHLHFETRLCGVALNPALLFDFRNQDVTGNFYTFKKETYDDDSRLATAERGKVGNGGYTRDLVQGGTPGHSKSANFNSSNEEILYHKVKKGETLYSIAEQRGVSVEMICRLNHITSRSKVRPGQILRYS
jgi:murein DD-endopeptidase MepM/ murein hydrolase activator NlpD